MRENRLKKSDLLRLTDFATAPVAATVLLFPCHFCFATLAVTITGTLSWTFLEYWMHRALHGPALLNFHMQHHRRPKELTGGTLYSSAIIAALMTTGCLFPIFSPVFAGVLLGYLWFISVHWLIHHKVGSRRLLGRLAENHYAHHRGRACMYGVSTSFWDHVFGTADP